MLGHKCVPMAIAEWEGINYYCWSCHRGYETQPTACDCGCRDVRKVSETLEEARRREEAYLANKRKGEGS